MRIVTAAVVVLCVPSLAHAQSELSRGVAAYANADFPGAVDHLDRAEAGGGLAPSELATLYETRALAHHALGEQDSVTADLRQLARVDPGHTFGPGAPPGIVQRFDRLRREMAVPTPAEVALATPAETPEPSRDDGDGAPAWPWLAGIAGVAVATVVVVLVATSGAASGETPVTAPDFP